MASQLSKCKREQNNERITVLDGMQINIFIEYQDDDYDQFDFDGSQQIQLKELDFEDLIRLLCFEDYNFKDLKISLKDQINSIKSLSHLESLVENNIIEYSEVFIHHNPQQKFRDHLLKDLESLESDVDGSYLIRFMKNSITYIDLIEKIIYAQCMLEETSEEIYQIFTLFTISRNTELTFSCMIIQNIQVYHYQESYILKFQLIIFSERRIKEFVDNLTQELIKRQDKLETLRSKSAQLNELYSVLLKHIDCPKPVSLKQIEYKPRKQQTESTDYSQYEDPSFTELEVLLYERLQINHKYEKQIADLKDHENFDREKNQIFQMERQCIQQKKGQQPSIPDPFKNSVKLQTLIQQINLPENKKRKTKEKIIENQPISTPSQIELQAQNQKKNLKKSNCRQAIESDEIKEFEKRLDATVTALASQQKLQPNLSQDWIKRLNQRIHKKHGHSRKISACQT